MPHKDLFDPFLFFRILEAVCHHLICPLHEVCVLFSMKLFDVF